MILRIKVKLNKEYFFIVFIAQSLGHTAFVPENDGYSTTKSQMLASMDVAFGGRIAEELGIFGIN